jgi:hypothetical protein
VKLVTIYGSVYRLSDRNYRKLLTTAAAGQEWNLTRLGGTSLGDIAHDVTDLDPETARGYLDDLKPAARTAKQAVAAGERALATLALAGAR